MSKSWIRWTEEEDKILREIYPTQGSRAVYEVLGGMRAMKSIQQRAFLFGFRKEKKQKMSLREPGKVIEMKPRGQTPKPQTMDSEPPVLPVIPGDQENIIRIIYGLDLIGGELHAIRTGMGTIIGQLQALGALESRVRLLERESDREKK